MKITAAVSSPRDVEPLLEAGADELYCGLVPSAWIERFGRVTSPNRRINPGASMTTEDDLGKLVRGAHGAGAEVHLTLNAPSYTCDQEALMIELAHRAQDLGLDAVIVADPGLLAALAADPAAPAVHVSSTAASLNSEAVRFWCDLGAARVILPRSLSVREIMQIAASVPQMPIEVFVMNDGCVLEEANCLTIHHHAVGPFCLDLARLSSRCEVPGAGELPAETLAAIAAHKQDHRRFTWSTASCVASTTSKTPAGPCGLCALPELSQVALAGKVVGREASIQRKLASVRMFREVLDHMASGAEASEVRRQARTLRAQPTLCQSGYLCYYR